MKGALIGIGFGCAIFVIALGVAVGVRWVQDRLTAMKGDHP